MEMGDARGAIDGAKSIGMTCQSVNATIDEWRAANGAWNIGALHWRLTHGVWPERSGNGQEEEIAKQELARTKRLLSGLGERPQIEPGGLTLKEQLVLRMQSTGDD